MLGISVPERRHAKRLILKRRAGLVINLDRNQMRVPCLVLDFSKAGFRLRGSFRVRRGQEVELIVDEHLPGSERCRVVWVGKPGSNWENIGT